MTTIGKKHHKRRNVGLMYEFIVGHIASAAGRDDSAAADVAVGIVRRRFKRGTELHREWRLFNAVANTSGVDETMANAIIREARDACRRYDRTKLTAEKTQLIHEVNRRLGQTVYDRSVERYKLLATIQTLFNDWRDPMPNIGRIAAYERQLQQHLMRSHEVMPTTSNCDMITETFAVKLMVEKVNRQFGAQLVPVQRTLLGMYVVDGMTDRLVESMRDVKDNVLRSVDAYVDGVRKNTTSDKSHAGQLDRLLELRSVVNELDLTAPDEHALARVLKLCELDEVLKT